MSTSTIAKADELVGKFFDNIAKADDNSWLAVRNQAGELLMKRAAIKFPELSPAEAMAKVANQPDDTDKALYSVQAIKSSEHFAAYRTVLNSQD